jgi:hypothetical protein
MTYNARMTAKDLYDQDFVEWTQCNAALLRAGRFDQVDILHIAEEIEDLGKNQQRELGSRLRVLITHLLKLRAERDSRAVAGWQATVEVQREEIRRLLKQAPSLRRRVGEEAEEVYTSAVAKAAAGTKLPRSSFPAECPFSPDQLLDPDYSP